MKRLYGKEKITTRFARGNGEWIGRGRECCEIFTKGEYPLSENRATPPVERDPRRVSAFLNNPTLFLSPLRKVLRHFMRQVPLAHKMPQHSLPLSQSSVSSVVNLFPLPATARRGFTLLELLVAGALIAVAATVVAGAFAAGFRVWQRASQQGGPYEEAVIALELIQKDVRNSQPFRLVPFRGTESGLEIPSVVTAPGRDSQASQMGSIRYEFSATSRELVRVTRLFSVPQGESEVREALLSKVESVRFSYADRGPDGKGALSWSGAWPAGTNIPVAVKVQVKAPLVDLERVVVLP